MLEGVEVWMVEEVREVGVGVSFDVEGTIIGTVDGGGAMEAAGKREELSEG